MDGSGIILREVEMGGEPILSMLSGVGVTARGTTHASKPGKEVMALTRWAVTLCGCVQALATWTTVFRGSA
jgi:hypothetical protein